MPQSEPNYSFTTVNRWHTYSAKWDLLTVPLGEQALSLSVADMEFATCPAVKTAVTAAAEHGIYGYTEVFEDYYQAVHDWVNGRHGWDIPTGQFIFFSRIVQMLSGLINYCYAQPPRIAVLTPTYGPLVEVIKLSGCELLEVPLQFDFLRNQVGFDHDALALAVKQSDILLWLSPHNPSGRVWTDQELAFVGNLALENQTLVISDDVHCDIVRGQKQYSPLGKVCPQLHAAGYLLTCYSPAKTFNIAGLEASAIVTANEDLRLGLLKAKRVMGLHNPNYFAVTAAVSGWRNGHSWVDQLNKQIDRNLRELWDWLRTDLPTANFVPSEGTYLQFVNLENTIGKEKDAVQEWMQSAQVHLSAGADFGADYSSWARFNVALGPAELRLAEERLHRALVGERAK